MPFSRCSPLSRLFCFAAIVVATQTAWAKNGGDTQAAFPAVAPSDANAISLPPGAAVAPPQLQSIDAKSVSVATSGPGPDMSDRAALLVEHALALVGVKYRWGGNSPATGLDCSGLVRYVFRDALGEDLPRRAIEISRLGERIGRQELQPGDLIFFRTLRRTISHVGIYLGDGQFIHAPARGQLVRVESLDVPYWGSRYSEARRIEP